VESPDGWGLGSILGPIAGLERSRKAFSSRAKRMYLTLRETTSATLLYYEAPFGCTFCNMNT
jgi:hypothetical protein